MSSEKKPVVATDIETGEKATYPSIAEAARTFKVKDDHIRRVLRGERKTSCGRTWEFVK